jgi:hypothetical protein
MKTFRSTVVFSSKQGSIYNALQQPVKLHFQINMRKPLGWIKTRNFYKQNHFFTTEKNTITSQLLQHEFVHLQLASGVWNLLQEGKN